MLGDVHRLRFLAHYVRQRASAEGFNAQGQRRHIQQQDIFDVTH